MTTYSNIPANQTATSKQVYAVASKFTALYIDTNKLDRKKTWKIVSSRVYAVLMNHKDVITHKDIQQLFALESMPQFITDNMKTEGLTDTPKPVKTKTAPKPKAVKTKTAPKQLHSKFVAKLNAEAVKTKVAKPVKTKPAPKKSVKTDDGMDARMTFVEQNGVIMMEKIESIESGLAAILLAVKG
jgi:hypothetical protein